MNDKILVEVAGVTQNRLGTNISALILREIGGSRCMPIIIGSAEAQSIQCCLHRIIPLRPLTHDLMTDILTILGAKLLEVYIHRLPDGIFAANMLIADGDKTYTIDARSSDAVALALRLDTPIYTSSELMDSAGFKAEDEIRDIDNKANNGRSDEEPLSSNNTQDTELRLKILETTVSSFSTDALQNLLKNAVEQENYHEAGIIKRELDKRNSPDRNAD